MEVYTCGVCNQKMERDLVVFMNHTQQHIVDEIKKSTPNGLKRTAFVKSVLTTTKKLKAGVHERCPQGRYQNHPRFSKAWNPVS